MKGHPDKKTRRAAQAWQAATSARLRALLAEHETEEDLLAYAARRHGAAVAGALPELATAYRERLASDLRPAERGRVPASDTAEARRPFLAWVLAQLDVNEERGTPPPEVLDEADRMNRRANAQALRRTR